MVQARYIQQYDNDILFVLDQHT